MPRASQQLVSRFTKDWRRLRQQKFKLRGGVEARVLLNLAMIFGEHYAGQHHDQILTRSLDTDEDKNKLHLVFNLIRRAQRRKIGRLWSIANEFHAVPDTIDPKAYDRADVVTDLVRALSFKLREKKRHWRRLFWLTAGGVVIEHIPWMEATGREPIPAYDPQTGELLWRDHQTGQTLPQTLVERAVQMGATAERFQVVEELALVGDVASDIIDPFRFFIDASVPTIADLAPDQSCYIAEIKTHGWIRQTFGAEAVAPLTKHSDLAIVQTRIVDKGPAYGNMNLRDMIPVINGEASTDDVPMSIVLTRYQPPHEEFPHGRRTILTPDGAILDDDDLAYEEVPCVDIHYEPEATTFWTPDFITDMVPANKFLNKRMCQLGEAANATIYEVLLLGPGLTAADIPTDYPGHVEDGLTEEGVPKVVPMQHGILPGWFVESIRLVIDYIDTVGGADLLQSRKFPGQLRGALSIPMLQELIDSEDGPLFEHLGEQLATIHQMRVNRVQQFYEPIRTLHYTGPDMKDEVLVFHTDQILRAGANFTITIDRSTLLPEISAIREAKIRDRMEGPLVGLYFNRRTGGIDWSAVAKELRYGTKDRESREQQYRKITRQLIGKIWEGEAIDPQVIAPFWDHPSVLDELEASMATMEYIEASPQVKQQFIALYEMSRQFLQELESRQTQIMETQAMRSAVAQATQQVAAKTAALTTEAALGQIQAQADAARANPPEAQIIEALGRTGRTTMRGPARPQ